MSADLRPPRPSVPADCPTCSAPLALEPGTDQLRCRHCKTAVPIPLDDALVGPQPYDPAAGALPTAGSHTVRSVTCRTCGGTTEISAKDTAGRCVFCKTPFTEAPHDEAVLRPHAVVPFSVTREKAAQVVDHWIGSRRFAPAVLRKEASVDRLNGVYVPCWRFDAHTSTDYTGERGQRRTESHTVRESDGTTKQETRQVTDWYPTAGQVEVEFRDVDVIASKGVHPGLTPAIEGMARAQLRPYREEYLYGFAAETYEVPLPDVLERAKRTMESRIDAAVRDDIGGDEQRVHSKRTSYAALTYWLLVLPVWIVAYNYRGKTYQVVVDGFAGDVKGKRPFSPAKIVAAVAVLVALIIVIAVVVAARK